MSELTYLQGYPTHLQSRAATDPSEPAGRRAAAALSAGARLYYRQVAVSVYRRSENQYLRNAQPLSKVAYDSKIHVMKHALGLHTAISRVQGGKLKAKAEIRVATVFRSRPNPSCA